ncbi:uncharacterized protein METZ01_LOCUS365970, partial [marine metagenome]
MAPPYRCSSTQSAGTVAKDPLTADIAPYLQTLPPD